VLGGELDGVGLAISETPRWTRGERIIAFIRPWGTDRLTVTGGAAGAPRRPRGPCRRAWAIEPRSSRPGFVRSRSEKEP
jgi:hypothetical protein